MFRAASRVPWTCGLERCHSLEQTSRQTPMMLITPQECTRARRSRKILFILDDPEINGGMASRAEQKNAS